MADQFSLPAAADLVDEAKEIADYVIIDSPPLTEVIDALPLAQHADDVLIVVRLGRSHLNKLARLGELLAAVRRSGRPASRSSASARTSEYGYYTERPVRDLRRDAGTPVLTR